MAIFKVEKRHFGPKKAATRKMVQKRNVED